MGKLKAAVVGAGGVATNFHLPAYLEHSGVSLVGVCELKDEARKQCQTELGLAADTMFSDLGEMLDQTRPDIVSICVPNRFHREVAVQCLKAGANVLCEKPPALSAQEVEEMIAAADASGKMLTFQFNNRRHPEVEWVFGQLDQIGEVRTAQVGWRRRNGIPGWGSWFTRNEMSGGGPIIDLLIHMLDVGLKAMGYPRPTYVLATATDQFGQDEDAQGPWCPPDPNGKYDVETASQGFILFDSGASVAFNASWAERIEREEVYCRLQGTKAGVEIRRVFGQDGIDDTAEDSCVICEQIGGQPSDNRFKGLLDTNMGRIRSVHAFVDSVISGTPDPLLPTPDEALTVMKIVDAIYKSASTKEPVKISS